MQNSYISASIKVLVGVVTVSTVSFPSTASATTFNFTGTIDSYTVPTSGVYNIEALGAQGGGGSFVSYPGGLGGEIAANFNLNAGEILDILVGSAGSIGAIGGGGGGGTFVVLNGTNPLIIAGGGGGSASVLPFGRFNSGGGGGGGGFSSNGNDGGNGGSSSGSGGFGGFNSTQLATVANLISINAVNAGNGKVTISFVPNPTSYPLTSVPEPFTIIGK